MRRTRAAWLLATAAAAGCAGSPHDHEPFRMSPISAGPVAERLVSPAGILVAPEERWTPGEAGWSFRGSARLLVWVREQPTADLVFRLVPDDATAQHHLRVEWNGGSLLAQPRPFDPAGEDVVVPRSQVTPGLHELEVVRTTAGETPDVRGRIDNRFATVSWRVGDTTTELDPSGRERSLRIAEFLDLGVTGASQQRFDGVLVDGPAVIESVLDIHERSMLSTEVVEVTGGEAIFDVAAGDEVVSAAVADGGHRRLEIELPSGRHTVRWTVRGADDGLHLWGAPDLRPVEAAGGTPVVVITLDTTRRDVLGVYGGAADVSPRIDRLSRVATVFDEAHATSPWTLPSHGSILTGLYGTRHGAGVGDDRLILEQRSLAEVFREHGYRTAGFAGGEMCASRYGLGQGFQRYRDPDGFETRGDRLTDAALEFLDRSPDPRLFLFVNYFDPHALYLAPEPHRTRFDVDRLEAAAREVPVWRELAAGDGEAWRAIVAGEAPPATPGILAWLRAAYLAEVAFMDEQIGRLLDGLGERGWLDPAMVVLVADHGEFLGEHGFYSHACRLDPELTEVPLIIKWPHQRTGGRSAALVSQVDLFATVAAVVDPTAPAQDGISLADPEAGALAARETVYMEEHHTRIHPLFENMSLAPHLFGLRRPELLEMVWRGGNLCEREIGGEWRTVACGVGWRERLDQLAALAKRPLTEGVSSGELSDAERERLEALGYIR